MKSNKEEVEEEDAWPRGGVAGFRSSSILGCVTKFAPHKALKLIASCKLTFDERVEDHRVVDFAPGSRKPIWIPACRANTAHKPVKARIWH